MLIAHDMQSKKRRLNEDIKKYTFNGSLYDFPEIISKVNLHAKNRHEVLHKLEIALATNILDLSKVRLYFADVNEYILPFLEKNPRINELNLYSCGLEMDSCELIAKSLKISKLNIGQNIVGDKGILLLADNKYLTDLRVSYTFFDNEEEACEALAANEQLIKLDISYNSIIEQGITALFKTKSITHLNLSSNSLIEIDEAVIQSLSENKSIICLDLSGNKISENAAKFLAKSPSIQELILSLCEIDDNCIIHLSKNTSFKKLHLSNNNVTDAGGSLLSRNQSLSDVDISYNACTIDIIKLLIKNKNITKLDVSGNSLSLEERDELRLSHKSFFDDREIMILHDEDVLSKEEEAQLRHKSYIKFNPF